MYMVSFYRKEENKEKIFLYRDKNDLLFPITYKRRNNIHLKKDDISC